MNLEQLHQALRERPDASLRLRLPNGTSVPPHFHITELGLVTKDFFDCGGTRRSDRAWTLQAWVADDLDHRLAPSKLAKILALHEKLGASADLPVRFEYQGTTLETYALAAIEAAGNTIELALEVIETDCLAKEQCGILPPNVPALSSCCAPGRC